MRFLKIGQKLQTNENNLGTVNGQIFVLSNGETREMSCVTDDCVAEAINLSESSTQTGWKKRFELKQLLELWKNRRIPGFLQFFIIGRHMIQCKLRILSYD